MGILKYLVIHCTATPRYREVTSEEICHWHTDPKPKGRGWSKVGYSDMIHLDGDVENLIPYNEDDTVDRWEISNGAKGYNAISRHVVYVGGALEKKAKWMKYYPTMDTRTEAQEKSLEFYVRVMIKHHPEIKIIGHNQISQKQCPCFEVPYWLKSIGINEKNIGL